MNFCPHCHSGNDPVLKDTTWSCGVRFNDSTWRTKKCYRRNLELANDRIKRLEEAGDFLSHYLREMPYASSYLAQIDERILRINNWREAKEDKL